MKQSLRRFFWIGLTGAAALTGASCTKRGGGAATELRDAGYTLTQEDWFKASAADDVEAMKQFAVANFAMDAVDSTGDTALHIAAGAGAEQSADFLLRRGLAIDLRGANDRTPLMRAVVADRPAMVGWLLRQGADPRLQDADGFRPLLLAVREGSSGSIVELAPYSREDLDNALLLAAMTGNAAAIDELTNYGASVYASMPDGRTPLMMAAESGHDEAVKLLLDIGASRFATDAQGFSAADYAREGGHEELVGVILREPSRDELVFQSPEEIATDMDAFVDGGNVGFTPIAEDVGAIASADGGADVGAVAGAASQSLRPQAAGPARVQGARRPPPPMLEGKILGVAATGAPRRELAPADPALDGAARRVEVPLVMRHYQAREMPIEVGGISEGAALLLVRGNPEPIEVRQGDTIPGTRLLVVGIKRRMEFSKVNPEQPLEVVVVEIRDEQAGISREWRSGLTASAHDPLALVEDAATGERYIAAPGQRFSGADGHEFIVRDVRPSQLVVEDAEGSVHTLPLRGPRG